MSCGYRPWDQNCRRTLLTQLTDRFFGRNSPSHGIFSCKRFRLSDHHKDGNVYFLKRRPWERRRQSLKTDWSSLNHGNFICLGFNIQEKEDEVHGREVLCSPVSVLFLLPFGLTGKINPFHPPGSTLPLGSTARSSFFFFCAWRWRSQELKPMKGNVGSSLTGG